VKRIQQSSDGITCSDSQENELAEDDDEIVDRYADDMQHLLVVYDIIHSPSYQVPVLYVTFKPCAPSVRPLSGPTNLDNVYELLAPASLQPQIQSIGVMGALSMADHPVTGTAAYFVHPCRTAEAMEAVTGNEYVTPQKYLLIWIGLVGQSVGLEVPIELAEVVTTAI
jgi:ubiquitin-like-conjugating enzyme ATG10